MCVDGGSVVGAADAEKNRAIDEALADVALLTGQADELHDRNVAKAEASAEVKMVWESALHGFDLAHSVVEKALAALGLEERELPEGETPPDLGDEFAIAPGSTGDFEESHLIEGPNPKLIAPTMPYAVQPMERSVGWVDYDLYAHVLERIGGITAAGLSSVGVYGPGPNYVPNPCHPAAFHRYDPEYALNSLNHDHPHSPLDGLPDRLLANLLRGPHYGSPHATPESSVPFSVAQIYGPAFGYSVTSWDIPDPNTRALTNYAVDPVTGELVITPPPSLEETNFSNGSIYHYLTNLDDIFSTETEQELNDQVEGDKSVENSSSAPLTDREILKERLLKFFYGESSPQDRQMFLSGVADGFWDGIKFWIDLAKMGAKFAWNAIDAKRQAKEFGWHAYSSVSKYIVDHGLSWYYGIRPQQFEKPPLPPVAQSAMGTVEAIRKKLQGLELPPLEKLPGVIKEMIAAASEIMGICGRVMSDFDDSRLMTFNPNPQKDLTAKVSRIIDEASPTLVKLMLVLTDAVATPRERGYVVGTVLYQVTEYVVVSLATAGVGAVVEGGIQLPRLAAKLKQIGIIAKDAKLAEKVEEIASDVKILGNSAERSAELAEKERSRFVLTVIERNELCFARNTPVAVSGRSKPIGEIAPGEYVKAFDFSSGEWVLAEVLKRHDNFYSGAMITVHVEDSAIEATVNHPFWVVRGGELDKRRVPDELSPDEDQGHALEGRWVLSQELQAGDLIFCVDGRYRRIVRIEQRYESRIEVSNLTVRGHHTFAVGESPVLVHNSPWCDSLRKAKGGWEKLTSLIEAAKREKKAIHAHHIVPKDIWKEYIPEAVPYLQKAQKILKDCDIELICDPRNLTWALNWDHSLDYAKAIEKTLTKAYNQGGKAEVEEALKKIEVILNKGKKFRGLE
ncbi:MAG: hypothetical protein IT426_17420 [Pirellulales bacterium]|nr:hypothetical protein [Pirellulales bacterium]